MISPGNSDKSLNVSVSIGLVGGSFFNNPEISSL